MTARIKQIAYYLPEIVLDNARLVNEFNSWSPDKIEDKVGIRERHIADKNETALDLAVKSCEKVLSGYPADTIDFLILCTQSPDYFLPPSSCIMQNKLGLKNSIGAIDINLGCSGYVYGLALAKGLLTQGLATNILFVVSETYSKYIHPMDKTTRTIFGDGAAATIIENSSDNGIFEFVFGTDGSGAENLIVKTGGHRNKTNPLAEDVIDDQGNPRNENCLYMDGTAIFNFTIDAVPNAFTELLNKNNMTIKDIDYVIFHQANSFMLNYLRKIIKIPHNKFYNNILHTGNTVSASIPIALKDCIDQHIVKAGDILLLLGFGVGYSWAGTIIQL